jgi:hypothetical protein
MKIQLTIKTTYLPTWSVYECIRELVLNGRDAEIEHQASLKVTWYNDTLRIENEGASLPLKALLLGHTTKDSRSDTIGKFGEGLKLGVLALVRAGHPVKIRNRDEVWIPSLERSDVFDEDVLTFEIQKGRKPENRVRVEVGGVTKEAWDLMKPCFLFLVHPKKDEAIKTYKGTLLLGEEYKGKIYVKGIFVQTDPELGFGYDLVDAELDRDRRMVESWNLKYATRTIFVEAMGKQSSLFTQFESMLQDPTLEVANFTDSYDAASVPAAAVDFVAERFVARHGADAVPVTSLAESADIEHLGKRGVIVPKQLGVVLAKKLGDITTVKEALRKEEVKRYGWGELTTEEKAALTQAIEMICWAEPLTLDDVEVVDYRSETLMGQYANGHITLARKYLGDPNETLAILVHEVAHRQGNDGDKGHVARIETIWKGITANLRRLLKSPQS